MAAVFLKQVKDTESQFDQTFFFFRNNIINIVNAEYISRKCIEATAGVNFLTFQKARQAIVENLGSLFQLPEKSIQL